MDKPVIAAIHGYALGEGIQSAIMCDMIIAAEGTQMGFIGAMIGGLCYGAFTILPAIVGSKKANELLLTCKRINAEEALQIGLVNQVCELPDLIAVCRTMAAEICAAGPIAIEQAKYAINYGMETDLHTGLAIESNAYWVCIPTEDRLEGLAAFREKRPPVYKGK